MDNHKYYKSLELKYWAGETDLIEEQALMNYAETNPDYFSEEFLLLLKSRKGLVSKSLSQDFESDFWKKVESGENKRNTGFNFNQFLKYAATGLIIVVFSALVFNILQTQNQSTSVSQPTAQLDTYESPEEAFEEAKRALMMASEKLKTGEEKLTEIKRFHHATVAVSGTK